MILDHELMHEEVIFVFHVGKSVLWVLAQVNTSKITQNDVNAALAQYTESQKYNLLKDKASKRQLLDSLVQQEILFQEAKKNGLHQSREYKAALKAFQKQYLSTLLVDKKVN